MTEFFSIFLPGHLDQKWQLVLYRFIFLLQDESAQPLLFANFLDFFLNEFKFFLSPYAVSWTLQRFKMTELTS